MYPTIKIPTCQTPFTKPSHTNQPSNTATMPQPSPSPQETQPFSQPSSAATMAHPSPSDHTKLSLSSQPPSAATMAHPSPSDHRKLSLSSQPSSAALMAHPTPGNPLNPPALINPHFRQSPTPPPLPPARNRTAWETGAGWLRLCRRGADSWLAEICVVFKKSAV